ncbi:MAG: ArnT family glycosyltransferase [Solirubrobacteraceae bacterium]
MSASIATRIGTRLSRPAGVRPARRLRLAHRFLAIVVLALIVRLVVVVATPRFVPQTDAADYDRTAVSLVRQGSFPPSVVTSHGGPSALRPPLFSIALAGVYKIVGVDSQVARWRAGRVLEALLGTIAVALIGLIALRLFGRGVALLAGTIAAVYPPLLLVGSSLMTESLYIPLALGAVLTALVHRSSAHRGRWAILTGLLIGLGELTRSNGIALVIPILVLVWPRPWRSWRALRAPLVVLVAAILTLAPWTIRDARLFHRFVPITTGSGYALAGTYNNTSFKLVSVPAAWLPPVLAVHDVLARNPTLDEAQISDRLQRAGLHFIGAHPAYPAKVALWNTIRLLDLSGPGLERDSAATNAYPPGLAVLSVYAFWLLGLLALVGALTRAARRAPWSFWACPLVLLASAVMLIGSTRYRSPADPFLIVLAALGCSVAWGRLRGAAIDPAPASSIPPA